MSQLYTYELENRALPVSSYRVFTTHAEAEDFAFEVAVETHFELRSVEWRRSDAKSAAGCSRNKTIWLPNTEFGHSVITILHELAHIAAPHDANHGNEWFHWFAYLLRNYVSVTAEAALRYEIERTTT